MVRGFIWKWKCEKWRARSLKVGEINVHGVWEERESVRHDGSLGFYSSFFSI